MAFSREYLERHKIHRVLEDCVEDLVVKQPEDSTEIAKAIVSRIDAIRKRVDSAQRPIAFVLAAPGANIDEAAKKAAVDVGAVVIDGRGQDAKSLQTMFAESPTTCSCFLLHYPPTIGELLAFEGTIGKPTSVILVTPPNYLDSTPTTNEAFLDFMRGPHTVAEYYNAARLLTVDDKGTDTVRVLANVFASQKALS